jgi:hypothetical protein
MSTTPVLADGTEVRTSRATARPLLLGALAALSAGAAAIHFVNGRQIGGRLTRWHSHLEVGQGGQIIIAGFKVALRGHCNPSTWVDRYTTQMLHVWVVPYPGGVFSDDLSSAATTVAARAALAETTPGHLAP